MTVVTIMAMAMAMCKQVSTSTMLQLDYLMDRLILSPIECCETSSIYK